LLRGVALAALAIGANREIAAFRG